MTQIIVVVVTVVQIGTGAAWRRGVHYIIIILLYYNISRWSRNVVDFYDIIIIIIMRTHV
jgi:hypothetical protein